MYKCYYLDHASSEPCFLNFAAEIIAYMVILRVLLFSPMVTWKGFKVHLCPSKNVSKIQG